MNTFKIFARIPVSETQTELDEVDELETETIHTTVEQNYIARLVKSIHPDAVGVEVYQLVQCEGFPKEEAK